MQDVPTYVWLWLLIASGLATYLVNATKRPHLAEVGRIVFWVSLLVHLARLAKLYG